MNSQIIFCFWIWAGLSMVNGKHLQLARSKRQTQTSYAEVSNWNDMKQNGIPVLEVGFYYLFDKNNSASFFPMLSDVYNEIQRDTDVIKMKVTDKLQEAGKIESVYNMTEITKNKTFEEAAIYVYSTLDLYKKLNEDLRIQNESSELASFALVLNAVLFNWCSLELVSATTYRGVNLSADIIALYQIGLEFVWLPFTSTSLNESKAKNFKRWMNKVIFVCDNSEENIWRPRKIYEMAYDPSLEEALYPSGCMFKVTDVNVKTDPNDNKTRTYIYVKLLNQNDEKENECDALGLLPYVDCWLLLITMCITIVYT